MRRRQNSSKSTAALPALRNFQDQLTNRLQYLNNYNWRLGSELYNRKFRLALESAGSAQDVLQSGEKQPVSIRAHVRSGAALYRKLPAARKNAESLDIFERQQTVIGAVLFNIAERRSASEACPDDARGDVEEARGSRSAGAW